MAKNNYDKIRHTCACCGRGLDPERPKGFNLCPPCRRREVSWRWYDGGRMRGAMRKDTT